MVGRSGNATFLSPAQKKNKWNEKGVFFYLANQTAVDRPLTSWPCSVGGKPSICGHLMNSIFPSIYKTMGSVYVYKVAGINSSARYFHGAAITEIRAAVPFVSIANSNSGNVNTTRFTHASWVSNPFPAFPVRALPDRDAGDVQKGNKQKKCKTSVLTEPNVFFSLCYCSTSKHMSPFLRKKKEEKEHRALLWTVLGRRQLCQKNWFRGDHHHPATCQYTLLTVSSSPTSFFFPLIF